MRREGCLVVLVGLLVGAAAQQPVPNGDRLLPPLPPGEGRDLVQTDCVGCHKLNMIFQNRKTKAAWAKEVNDMIQRGAAVFPEEIEPITAYLSKNFGSDMPPPINVNTADRAELEKLPGIKPEMVERILNARAKAGSFKDPDELRRALRLDKDEFAKDFYLLKYN
ncbi:MAG TPA: helix-hairpin-helix domain-containing protein [Terriglobales bacterium]|nr:helix-hairpin-helix domain-containing protein [Terriglobales bacterium]